MTGAILGYDPGGEGCHGIARLDVRDGIPIGIETGTVRNASATVGWATKIPDVLGLGIDTLTTWSTGRCGWRPADRWLRETYPSARDSVITPNFLSGSMAINGMAVLLAVRQSLPELPAAETHPKVLYFALTQTLYWDANLETQKVQLAQWLGVPVVTARNEHEWDAAVSAYAMWQGLRGSWTRDLHASPCTESEALVSPAGPTQYFWPPNPGS